MSQYLRSLATNSGGEDQGGGRVNYHRLKSVASRLYFYKGVGKMYSGWRIRKCWKCNTGLDYKGRCPRCDGQAMARHYLAKLKQDLTKVGGLPI